ncbi:hypothetical protein ACIGXA_39530 [Streptomyces fildesensis]|uniref:Uncharacterized protein n=1 Tax=Streptomyces fildesensis TaxID=375757 RepID=A0ABW8CLF5_9ACTN
MSGDSFHQYGAGSIGKAQHSGSGDIVADGKRGGGSELQAAAIDKLLGELQNLKQHLDGTDQVEVDAAAAEIASNPPRERLRKLLQTVSGIATLVGEVGSPVIGAIKAILASA